MRHDAPRVFGTDRPATYGAPVYGPPYGANVFRPPLLSPSSQFIPQSRPAAPYVSSAAAAPPAAATAATAASSSAKAAEALAQQQAAEDKRRGYATIKGKPVAVCKRKNGGAEELKVRLAMQIF